MNLNKSKNNRNYLISNSHKGLDIELFTSTPNAKRAKKLTLKSGNKSITLNGHQINVLKRVFVKENLINGLKTTIY